MLKNVSRLELMVNGKLHQYTCDADSPTADVKEALFQMQKFVGMIEDQIREKAEKEKQEKESQDVVVEHTKEV